MDWQDKTEFFSSIWYGLVPEPYQADKWDPDPQKNSQIHNTGCGS